MQIVKKKKETLICSRGFTHLRFVWGGSAKTLRSLALTSLCRNQDTSSIYLAPHSTIDYRAIFVARRLRAFVYFSVVISAKILEHF